MSEHPFQGEKRVDRLYASSERLRRRSSALLAAKRDGRNPNATIVEFARRRATPPPRLLEVGCGRGGALRRMIEELAPSRVVALDRSPAMLAAAQSRAGGPIEAIRGDFHQMPFPSGEFDLIVAAFCLYHSPHPARACAEIARCLDDEGIAILATKSADSYRELDAIVAATGLDPGAESARGLYDSFNSDNLVEVARDAFSAVEVRHELHRFVFDSPRDAAAYASTVPKYAGCADPEHLARSLEAAWPAAGLAMTSTVSVAAATR